ncbi:di-/tripeptide transporter [Vibrio ishigakensis]|uniref:Di-/tripeptide transporter n=1 Tax=Vibrio ishigakensis TaxID=1481914 RepID=A0A0B8NTI0_9VIBR|nr:di-/tripeptide transporter [Vibrio ishigakensis]
MLTLLVLKKPFSPLGKTIDTQPISAKTWGIFVAVSVAMIALVFFMFSNMDVGQNIVYAIGLSPSDISSH